MGVLELHIPGIPPPSFNRLLSLSFRARFALKREWRDKAGVMATICRLPRRPLPGRPRVLVRYFFRDVRRRDRDNYTSAAKWILDSLVRHGTLRDDSDDAIDLLPVEIHVDRANPRTQVLIEV